MSVTIILWSEVPWMVDVFLARDGLDEKIRSKNLFSLVLSSWICISCAGAVRFTSCQSGALGLTVAPFRSTSGR